MCSHAQYAEEKVVKLSRDYREGGGAVKVGDYPQSH